jgi:hypothetical protein
MVYQGCMAMAKLTKSQKLDAKSIDHENEVKV